MGINRSSFVFSVNGTFLRNCISVPLMCAIYILSSSSSSFWSFARWSSSIKAIFSYLVLSRASVKFAISCLKLSALNTYFVDYDLLGLLSKVLTTYWNMLSSSSSMKSCCSLGLTLSLSFSRSSFTSSSLSYLFRLFAIANALTSCSWLSSTRIADISSCSRSILCLVFYSASFNLSFEF